MGSGSSITAPVVPCAKMSLEEEISSVLPVYYVDEELTNDCMNDVRSSWSLVLTDTAPKYLEWESVESSRKSCAALFSDVFYRRLIEMFPSYENSFSNGLFQQGKSLVKMISLTISQLHHTNHFAVIMQKLAENHCKLGVKAYEFGVMGEILFHSLRRILGDDTFSKKMETSWVVLYSSMLKHIVPICVVHERSLRLCARDTQPSSEEERRNENVRDLIPDAICATANPVVLNRLHREGLSMKGNYNEGFKS